MERVSVVMPTYNRGYIIRDAINSVLNQTYKNLELIIVDDGSDDDTEDVIKSISDSRIIYIKLEGRHGANYARNVGCKRSNGKYIAFIDSDNKWLVDKLEKQLSILVKERAQFIFSKVSIDSPKYGKFCVPDDKFELKDFRRVITNHNIVDLNTILIEKQLIADDKFFDESLPRFQDWDFVLNILFRYNCEPLYINSVLCENRILRDSIGANFEKKVAGYKAIVNKYIEKMADENLSESLVRIVNESEKDEQKIDLIYNALKSKTDLQNRVESELKIHIDELNDEKKSIEDENVRLREEKAFWENELKRVYNSTCWKITKPIRVIGKGVYFIVNIIKTLKRKSVTAYKILKEGGIKQLLYTIKHYDEIKAAQRFSEEASHHEYLGVDSEYQDNIDYTGKTTDIKLLAFHLPQYHTFPENDEWWGKGFTEWTNVRQGDSRFEGHYQPRIPHNDIGYYDLSDIETLRKQAELAKQHGLYGFCFYYYWFSGKRLMEKPVDMLLEHPEIDLPFCLCWANENWTRAWDGMNKNVLIAQDYSDEDDDRFILDLKKYIDDERYIRVNGKPLVVVYNPGQIPDCKKSFAKWRKVARECGIGEILIWTCRTANNYAEKLGIEECIDAEVEFPPHNYWEESLAVRNVDLKGKSAFLFSYSRLVDFIIDKVKNRKQGKVPMHNCCMMGWDNAARRKDAWFTYTGFSLKSFYRWMLTIFERTRQDFPEEERLVFINAWNEWGEGTYLEPDKEYGYANINTVSKALFNLPLNDDFLVMNDNKVEAIDDKYFENQDGTSRIAVQIHMFYLETLDETIKNLNYIPYKFDCFISTDTEEKKTEIDKRFKESCNCSKYVVEVYENRGRDVAPFLVQMHDRVSKYDYLCHIHSKKTKTNEHGNEWREYIFEHLFGGAQYMRGLFNLFETDSHLGIIMPETYPVLELQAEWGGNREGVESLLKRIGVKAVLPEKPVFPVGNMFWMRTSAVKRLFDANFSQLDFPVEAGQVNATIAHQIERSWVYLAKEAGYTYKKLFNNCRQNHDLKSIDRGLIYVHYDKDNEIKESDIKTLECYSSISDSIIFVSNSNLIESELHKVKNLVDKIIIRNNKGYDFGAWSEALLQNKEELVKFDELILLNNSCFEPLFDIKEMFGKMEHRDLDFWGNTIFPFTPDGTYIGEDHIDEHLQSYFMVFNKNVLKSDVFWEFWENLPECNEFIEVVAKCESKFTKKLSDAGFKYEPYIKESYYISRFLNNYAIPYEKPCSLVLLKDTFVKKKCYQYMDIEEKIKLEYLKLLLND